MAGEVSRRDEGEMGEVRLVGRVNGEESMAIEAPLFALFHDS